jgi:hypothetical protein
MGPQTMSNPTIIYNLCKIYIVKMSDLRFAMICASNVNRSVAAHALLQDHDFDVRRFSCELSEH